jgi:ABC-type transport system involved in cytochrome c biogenesis permease component
MTFLPLIGRELRLRARKRSTYWSRFGIALAGILACLPHLLAGPALGTPATTGSGVFRALVITGFLLCLSACLLSANALARERREGTLELLLLTRVSSFDILLAKLGSAGLTVFWAQLVLLPMLLLPLLAGGVTPGEIARDAAGLANALFLALSVGLFACARGAPQAGALLRAAGLMTFIVLAPLPALLAPGSWPFSKVALASPLYVLLWKSSQPFGNWCGSLLLVHATGWALLWLAASRFGCDLKAGNAEGKTSVPAQPSLPHKPLPPVGDHDSPMAARLAGMRGIQPAFWIAVFLTASSQLANLFVFRSPRAFGSLTILLYQLPSLAIYLCTGGLIAWGASRFFVESKKSGELELLLTTPLARSELMSGQIKHLFRLLKWPMLVTAAFMALQIVLSFFTWRSFTSDGWVLYYLVPFVLSLVSLLLTMWALCWNGLYYGFREPSQPAAIVWTLVVARFVPYLATVFLQSAVLGLIAKWVNIPALRALANILPQAISMGLLFWLAHRARRKLAHALNYPAEQVPTIWETLLHLLRASRSWPNTPTP